MAEPLDDLPLPARAELARRPVSGVRPRPHEPIVLGTSCLNPGYGNEGAWETTNLVILPRGIRGETMLTAMTSRVPLDLDLDGDGLPDVDEVTDLDAHHGWVP